MHWPKKLTIHLIALARDGGSQMLHCTDERGAKRCIELHQRMFLRHMRGHEPIPGRLHLDQHALELRSTEEAGLVALLRSADYHCDLRIIFSDGDPRRTGPEYQCTDEGRQKLEEDLRARVAGLIAFVESEEYRVFGERIIRGDFDDFDQGRGGYGRRRRR
jgi:hypothetical protein